MVMKVDGLAKVIMESGTNSDSEGKPLIPTSQAINRAKALITVLKASTVTFLPGTITGDTSSGGPLVDGAGKGGKFLPPLIPAPGAAIFRIGAPDATSELEDEMEAFMLYLTTEATFFFKKGSVTGICGSSGTNPGPLVGEGKPGRITDINGAACTSFLATQGIFTGPESINHYNAIFKYLKLNLELRYSTGEVSGTCPTSSGPLSGGTAAGGKVV